MRCNNCLGSKPTPASCCDSTEYSRSLYFIKSTYKLITYNTFKNKSRDDHVCLYQFRHHMLRQIHCLQVQSNLYEQIYRDCSAIHMYGLRNNLSELELSLQEDGLLDIHRKKPMLQKRIVKLYLWISTVLQCYRTINLRNF